MYLYGVVEPATGDHFFFSFSHLDTICFQIVLDQVAAMFSHTFHIILLDQGTVHLARALEIPENVALIFQPAATSELNPIERVWQYINDRMALRNFASLDELFNAMSAILDGSTHEMFRSLTGFDYVLTAVNGVFI